MLVKEVVYAVLDNLKQRSDDSYISEEHILFTASAVRAMLIEQKYKAGTKADITDANTQTICVPLEQYQLLDNSCSPIVLRSISSIPKMSNLITPKVFPDSFLQGEFTFVSKERFKYVGYNKYLKNIIYCALFPDYHLYFKSSNPQHLHLQKVKVTAVFYDFRDAWGLHCEQDGTCSIMETQFPLQQDLIPALLDTLTKFYTSTLFKPLDYKNNAADDISTLVRYLATNMKSDFQKQLQN